MEGKDWYKRSMRAHANCVENLPVFGAIVLALYASGVSGQLVNLLCISVIVTRVAQSLVHVCFVQGNTAVAFRFTFFFVQVISFVALIVSITIQAGTAA